MGVPYEVFIDAFLQKITEYEFIDMVEVTRDEIVEGYLKRAVAGFKKNCRYDLTSTKDDDTKMFNVDIDPADLDEIVEIISEGMVVQWLKPYVYKQENLENAISTRDFSVYSPAELLMRVGNAYNNAKKDYVQMVREYSYNTGDLSDLHI